MSYRFMRVIVFFVFFTDTAKNRHDYTVFRKFLIKNGFLMLQQSVYVKLALNQTTVSAMIDSVKKNKPPAGLVQILTVTEKQFQKIELVSGEFSSDIINSDERLIIL